MKENKKFLDIEDRKKTFDTIRKRLDLIAVGFRAIYADYSHHIQIVSGESEISKLKDNIDFRFFASQFHLELILRQHYTIENRVEEIYQKEPDKVLNYVYPSHPLVDHCENEITAIFDSIIFHLASIYDYLSAIVNFIINKKDQSITKWSQLTKACRDTSNMYSKKSISKIIIEEDKKFVNKLYQYRSRVIHEKSERSAGSISIKLASGKTNACFIASPSLTKKFSELKEMSNNFNLTVNYVTDWLINNTIDSIAKILLGLKIEIESVSTYPNHIKDDDIIIFYMDPETKIGYPASKPLWAEFLKGLNIKE
ncbi:hypothetical protein ACFLTE_09030 [Bacteroidota bacterium]